MYRKTEKKRSNIVALPIIIFLILFMRLQSYYSQKTFYSKGAIILTALFSVGGIIYCLLLNNSKITLTRHGIGGYLFLFWLFSLYSTHINYNLSSDIYEVIASLTLYFGIYLLSSKLMSSGYDIQKLSNGFFAIEIIFSAMYIVYRFNGLDISSGAVNSVYFIITLLPLIMINHNVKVRWIGLILIILVTVISNKRTAFLMVLSAVLIYILLTLFLKNINMKKKLALIVLVLISALIVYYVYGYLSTKVEINIFNRLETLSEDGGSGRDIIYESVISKIKEFNFFECVIGHGYNGVFLTSGIETSAHNDFLEIIYDYGFTGLAIYVAMICKIISITIKKFRTNATMALAGTICLVMFLFMSTFSHLLLYPTYFMYFIVFWSVMCHEDNAY